MKTAQSRQKAMQTIVGEFSNLRKVILYSRKFSHQEVLCNSVRKENHIHEVLVHSEYVIELELWHIDLPCHHIYHPFIMCSTLFCFEKYEPDHLHILYDQQVDIREDMTYIEQSVCILDRKEHVLR